MKTYKFSTRKHAHDIEFRLNRLNNELSPEELLKLELMMKGLSDEKPLKQLTGGAGGV